MAKYLSHGMTQLVESINTMDADFKLISDSDKDALIRLELRMLNELQVIEMLVKEVSRDMAEAFRRRRASLQEDFTSEAQSYVRELLTGEKKEGEWKEKSAAKSTAKSSKRPTSKA